MIHPENQILLRLFHVINIQLISTKHLLLCIIILHARFCLWDRIHMVSVSSSVCFDYDVELQARIQLATVMADHVTAVIFTAQPRTHPPLPPSSLPTVLQRPERFSTFLHHSCPTLCLSPCRGYGSICMIHVCVCERENRHLEGHDKVREMKLGLQVQLDGHILHTCR